MIKILECCRNCKDADKCENYAHTKQPEWVCLSYKPKTNIQISLFDIIEQEEEDDE